MSEMIAYGYLPAFAEALAGMLQAGTALPQALDALAGLEGDDDAGAWHEALHALCREVEAGDNLSKAMSQHRDIFPGLLVCLVRAGEVSSILDRTLERFADYTRKEHSLCAGGSPDTLAPALEAALWCRRLHVLLVSGVPILQSMEVSVNPPASDSLREAVLIARASVREGQSIAPSLRDFPQYFPPFATQLLKLGEEKGTLEATLLTVAQYLENAAKLPAPPPAEGTPPDLSGSSQPAPPGWVTPGQPLTPEEAERLRQLQERGSRRGVLNRLVADKGSDEGKVAARAQAGVLGMSFVDLEQFQVNPEAVALLDRDFAQRQGLIAVQRLGQRLYVAMKDPSDEVTRDRIAEVTGMQVVAALATASDVDRAIEHCYAGMQPPAARPAQAKSPEEPPIVRVANAIIQQAIKDGASDIHVEPGTQHTRVRFRLDGILHEIMQLPIYIHPPLLARLKLMAGLSTAERRAPQRGLIAIRYADADYGLRVQTYPFADGEGAAIHIAGRREPFTTLAGLGMLDAQAASCEHLLHRPCGVLVVAGPGGSGCSTTLHTMARLLSRGECSVVTLAEPVEETLDGIKQIPLDLAHGLTYAEGVRGLMRQDPDILLLDRVPDAETAAEVAHAAANGHLLVVGVAATDAAHGIEKLVRLDPEGMPGQLIGAVGQHLLRTLCTECGGSGRGQGEEHCPLCRGSRYRGRTGIFEVVEVGSPEMQRLLRACSSRAAIRTQAGDEGMVTLAQAASAKIGAGLTDEAEVRRLLG